jgi:translation initiation factor 4A
MNSNTFINEFNVANVANVTSVDDRSLKDQPLNIETFSKWDDLNIDPKILRGIYSYGFEIPSPIQSKSIISICKGYDVIAQAQSGTGKTAAFTIGTLSHIDTTYNHTQAIILAPTRELAIQITSVVKSIGCMISDIKIKTIIGGTSINGTIDEMRINTPHIVVGCPGRIYDMIRRNHIDGSKIKILVMDEADEMLSAGFTEQIKNIITRMNSRTQIVLFSATLPENIHEITDNFMRNPINIIVKSESLTLEGIKQYYIAVNDDYQKYLTLKDIYHLLSVSQCIIYCNSVSRVMHLYNSMKHDDFPVSCIHSNMDRIDRETSFNEFKCGESRVLISSDVTSRGIDIQQVSTVINFDVPKNIHTYLHRIGRSGRFGRKGCGINLITQRDIQTLKNIEKYYATEIQEFPNNVSI